MCINNASIDQNDVVDNTRQLNLTHHYSLKGEKSASLR
jgi:hypothetical protein